jgi:molecular chaperone DnaK (HSP70)
MIFGIDLGTTNSCIARLDDAGKPVIVKSALGEDTTPSVVYFESPRNVVVGRAAKNEALLAPDLVAQLVKRDMGTSVQYAFHGERHTPETVSALILRELARATEESTGQVVRDVVITVPAYFGLAEREATRRAGQLAGLTVLDVLAEPVAAALHYQEVTGGGAGRRHLLVYDLGGGTFDTTVIRIDGDETSVICTGGDPQLGGADWDEAIAGYLLDQFAAEHPRLRPRDDAAFMQDLLISVEQLKQALSSVKSRRHVVRFQGAATPVDLSRDKLEEITADLLQRTEITTERTIRDARFKGVEHFDDVVLVGGMTRMPAVTGMLRERFGLTARHHEPDLAVAKGAAIFALMRTVRPAGDTATGAAGSRITDGGGAEARTPQEVAALLGQPIPNVEEMGKKRVATVAPRGFGVKSLDARDPKALTDPLHARQVIMHLLAADTPLPADTGAFHFQTTAPNQRMALIEVWEQATAEESEDLADNRKIGEGIFKRLPPGLPAQALIEITFFMSETGQLTVQAIEPESGARLQFDLQIGGLDKAAMDQARQSVAGYDVSG